MKLLVFGSCNIDRVYRLDHIVAPGETERTCDYAVFPGGKGLTRRLPLRRRAQKSALRAQSGRTANC